MNPNLNLLKIYFTIWILHFTFPISSQMAIATTDIGLDQGHEAFQQQNYSRSLEIYRAYLRQHPESYDIWNLLGASYYHNGQPRLALIALKKSLKSTTLKSQNYFYQGNCYQAINQPNRAKLYFKKTTKANDSFAALALFELIGLENDHRNFETTKDLVNKFFDRYPSHPLLNEIQKLSLHINKGIYIPLQGTQKQRYQENLYHNHRLSVLDIPHFWYFQTGIDYSIGTRSNPAYRGAPIVETGAEFEENFFKLSAGFGIGPLQRQDSQINLGYYYSQNWFTNNQRVDTYGNDPLDFTYFPYRPDLQNREHLLFFEMETSFAEKIDVGIYGNLFFIRSGSKIYPAPERPEIRQSTNIAQGNGLIPWISYRLSEQQYLYTQLYFNKYIDLEQRDKSSQSYAIFSSSTSPFFSFTLGYKGTFFKNRFKLGLEGIRFRYLTNNFWDEYQRLGIALSLQYRVSDSWKLMLKYLTYQDNYIYDQIKSGSCDFNATLFQDGITCPRQDFGNALRGGISYQPSKHRIFSLYVGMKNHTNPELKVYDEERFEIYALYTLAFPSVEKAARYQGRLQYTFTEKEVF